MLQQSLDTTTNRFISDALNQVPVTFGTFVQGDVIPFQVEVLTKDTASNYVTMSDASKYVILNLGVAGIVTSSIYGTGTLSLTGSVYTGSLTVYTSSLGAATSTACVFEAKISGSKVTTYYQENVTLLAGII